MDSDDSVKRSSLNARVEQNRAWGRHTVSLQDKEFVVLPDIFSPQIGPTVDFVLRNLPFPTGPDAALLEIGAGCGAISIIAALKGCGKVVATDISLQAVENTILNATAHGVSDTVSAIQSDIFDKIPVTESFDMIFWNHPFGYAELTDTNNNLDALTASFMDPGYKLLNRYLQQAHKFLKPNGSVWLTNNNLVGNIPLLKELALQNGWNVSVFKSETRQNAFNKSGSFELSLFKLTL